MYLLTGERSECDSSASDTCGEQVFDGVRVLKQPHGVHPQLQSVAVAVGSFGVRVEPLQAAHPVEVYGKRLLLAGHLVQVEGVRLWHVEHPCGYRTTRFQPKHSRIVVP